MREWLWLKLSLLRDRPWMPYWIRECIDWIRYTFLFEHTFKKRWEKLQKNWQSIYRYYTDL